MSMPLICPSLLGTAVYDSLTWPQDDLIAPMLILVLGMAMGICLICLLLVVHHVRSKPGHLNRVPWKHSHRNQWAPTTGHVFRPPSRWVAVHTSDLIALQRELGIQDPVPCTWEEGLGSVKDEKLFLSPPINNWILVMGASLPDPSSDVDQCFRFVQSLSRVFGRVQFFQAESVVNYHAWVIADRGQILRAYAWADETQWNQGVMTKDEIELKMRCYDYLEQHPPDAYGEISPLTANTDRVVLLASRWSVDPSSINAQMFRQSTGITGHPTA